MRCYAFLPLNAYQKPYQKPSETSEKARSTIFYCEPPEHYLAFVLLLVKT